MAVSLNGCSSETPAVDLSLVVAAFFFIAKAAADETAALDAAAALWAALTLAKGRDGGLRHQETVGSVHDRRRFPFADCPPKRQNQPSTTVFTTAAAVLELITRSRIES
jgi:hypothetical protein